MEEVRQKSWFARNWGWLLGGGCLTIIVLFVLGIGAAVFKISDSITSSEPYMYAMTTATENKKVIELLGAPIEKNGMGNTSFSYNNGNSSANLRIPVKGSRNEGNIVIIGEEIDGEWTYSELYLKIDDSNEKINLLD